MPDEGWTPVAKSASHDWTLSNDAVGLLTRLLTYPDGWETTVEKLVQLGRQAGGKCEGRGAMKATMEELADAGYVRYVRRQTERGLWTTEIEVSDAPLPGANDRRTGNPTVGGTDRRKPEGSVNRLSDFRSVTSKTNTKTDNNTEVQRSSKQDSRALASLAVAADTATDHEKVDQHLNHLYDRINQLTADQLRRGLLALERKRPKIFGECRRHAIDQIKNGDSPQELNGDQAAGLIDRLSYKWAAVHYSPEWPQWFLRPLGVPPNWPGYIQVAAA